MAIKKFVAVLFVLSIVTLACGTTSTPTEQATPELAQLQAAVQQTLDYENAVNAQLTQAAQQAQPPAQPPTVELPTVQPTPSGPMISVSMDTNCREGPSAEIWKAIGALLVGQKVEILAKYDKGHWYIIRNPNNPNQRCWVYDGYATIEGDTTTLPKATVPPTPTPH